MDVDFPGTERFLIARRLGSGGMGAVYEAYDRERNIPVALKVISNPSGRSLFRFKREFRALADITHTNLVSLYELVAGDEHWFFSMELVQGVDFHDFVRAGDFSRRPQQDSTSDALYDEPTQSAVTAPISSPPPLPVRPGLDDAGLARLRGGLAQLATGLHALHGHGKVHRDVKPTNLLVAPGGRVVILDFGLSSERTGRPPLELSDEIVGTLQYMAPEQARGDRVTAAADWYSVGVLLYEALTERSPFPSNGLHLLHEKQEGRPPPPRTVIASVPEDLDHLCIALLEPDPAKRPSGREVLERLGVALDAQPSTPDLTGPALVGRERQIAALQTAFEAAASGRPVLALVRGESGIGKSAIVERFLADLSAQSAALCFSGRCYENESVPYKALDSLVDVIAQHLEKLPTEESIALIPAGAGSLARVFPILAGVVARARLSDAWTDVADPKERRRRASQALLALMASLSRRGPLVLHVDDVHWGDADSAEVLAELVRTPGPLKILLIASYRIEYSPKQPCLEVLLDPAAEVRWTFDRRMIDVGPLDAAEAESLALALMGPERAVLARAVANESGGSPLFMQLLGHDAAAVTATDRISLEEVIRRRAAALPSSARKLLEVLAVAGRPLRAVLARKAAGIGAEAYTAADVLRSSRLIRSTGPSEDDPAETFHDRIRSAIVAGLPADVLRRHHRALVRILEREPDTDPEALASHLLGAGDHERAARQFAESAKKALEALAFDRAAQLFGAALDSRVWPHEQASVLRLARAEALEDAGRGREAAEAYLIAADGQEDTERLELTRRAAAQFLATGHREEGMAALKTVLEAVGLELPESSRSAAISLATARARLRLGGFGFSRKDPESISQKERFRIDTCWIAGMGLTNFSLARSALFHTRSLLFALKAGDPYRIARALSMESVHVATPGGAAAKRGRELLEVAAELARESGSPHAEGIVELASGIHDYSQGRFGKALESCERAERTFRERCRGVTWELDTARMFALWSMTYLGSVDVVAHRWPALIQEARRRNDLYASTTLGTYVAAIALLAHDRPEDARRVLALARSRSTKQHSFHIHHHNAVHASVLIDLYIGDAEAACSTMERRWSDYERSYLLEVQQFRVEVTALRGRAALAACDTGDRTQRIRIAEYCARRLEREKVGWADALALSLRAGLLRASGASVSDPLARAAAAFDAHDMALFAAACRYEAARLEQGSMGTLAAADALRARGVVDPLRMSRTLVSQPRPI